MFVVPGAGYRQAWQGRWRRTVLTRRHWTSSLYNCCEVSSTTRLSNCLTTGNPVSPPPACKSVSVSDFFTLYSPVLHRGCLWGTSSVSGSPPHSVPRCFSGRLSPVHSLMLSTQLFFCLPLLRPSFTVPYRIVFCVSISVK